MSTARYQIPDPADTRGLVATWHGNAAQGHLIFADQDLKNRLNDALSDGDAVVALIANNEKLSKPADIDEDNVFGGTSGMIDCTARILTVRGPTPLTADQEARAKTAAQLQQHWIGGNLRFLTLNYAAEWRECDIRIKNLDNPMSIGLPTPRQALTALGLDWTIERLQAVHQTYSQALGFAGLNDDVSKKFDAWESALNRFLTGLTYHHEKNPEIQALFFAPYEVALEAGRARRRQANERRAAAKNLP
jgi:hypothetical protein